MTLQRTLENGKLTANIVWVCCNVTQLRLNACVFITLYAFALLARDPSLQHANVQNRTRQG
jgi:hypothetical protein